MARELTEVPKEEEKVKTEEVKQMEGGEEAKIKETKEEVTKSPDEEKKEEAVVAEETAGEEMDSIAKKLAAEEGKEDDERKEENSNEPEEEEKGEGKESDSTDNTTTTEEEGKEKEEVTDKEQQIEVGTEVNSSKDGVEVKSPEPSGPTETEPQEEDRMSKRRRDEEDEEDSEEETEDKFSRRILFKPSTSDTDPNDEDDDQMTFREAEERIRQLPKFPSDQDVLLAYALHQQSLLGDNNTEYPQPLDFVGKEKWDSWSELKGLTQEDAKLRFIHLVRRLELELDP